MIGKGHGIHWEDIAEDISLEAFWPVDHRVRVNHPLRNGKKVEFPV